MALKRSIFAPDPDAPKNDKPVFADPDFFFRSGMQVNNKPMSLSTWRVLTDKPSVADAVAELLGGKVESAPRGLAVLTEADSVEIVIDGSKAIDDRLIKWGPSGQPPIHECDGETFLGGSRKGKPCGCPTTMAERKEAAKEGWGPTPNIKVDFRLAHDYELGLGRLIGTAWTLAEAIFDVKDALDAIQGEALCRLTLEKVEFVSDKYGPVSYTKPVIEVLGSYSDAIAEER